MLESNKKKKPTKAELEAIVNTIIPEEVKQHMIDGFANIELDEEGLRGRFTLYDESNSDADAHKDEWNFVIGAGFFTERGNYIGSIKDAIFENTTFNLKEAINRYVDLRNHCREIHFDKIKEK